MLHKTIFYRPENLLSNRIDRAPRSQRVARAQVSWSSCPTCHNWSVLLNAELSNKLFEFMQLVKNSRSDPHPVKMLLQVPRSHQQQVKKRKLVFLQSSPDYCRFIEYRISHQNVSNLIIIFTFMIIRMNVTTGYKGVVGRTCKTDPNRCFSICFEGLL